MHLCEEPLLIFCPICSPELVSKNKNIPWGQDPQLASDFLFILLKNSNNYSIYSCRINNVLSVFKSIVLRTYCTVPWNSFLSPLMFVRSLFCSREWSGTRSSVKKKKHRLIYNVLQATGQGAIIALQTTLPHAKRRWTHFPCLIFLP